MQYDVIIIGGSYSGLAAATQLARARRTVLVIDSGQRRNRFAQYSHGFLTRDGSETAQIAAIGREQLLAYPTVDWLEGVVTHADASKSGFSVQINGSDYRHAAKLILATGVIDQLPTIPGLAEHWGQHIFHCPYCHGYELNQGNIGVLATSELSMHHALMLPDWGPTTLFLNGAFEPDQEQLAQLKTRGTQLERSLVKRIDKTLDTLELILEDGHHIQQDGLFVATHAIIASPIAAQLGCDIEVGPLGELIKTDATKETNVAGVFACGDAARQPHSVSFAVSDGAMAGVSAHRALMFG